MISQHSETERALRVRLLNTAERTGGAAIATARLHDALVEKGHDARLHVARRQTDNWRVIDQNGTAKKAAYQVRAFCDRIPAAFQKSPNPVMHSPAWMSQMSAKAIDALDTDIVNLHWIVNGFLSVEEIGRIRKPIVWTLHDSWAFCGAEHHPDWRGDVRYRDGYSRDNRLAGATGLDIDRWVWRRKKRAWTRPFHVVAPSEWLAASARDSALFRNFPVSVIPNVLPTHVFRPIERRIARDILRLPADATIVLFGAIGGHFLKGWDLMQVALTELGARASNVVGVILGMGEPEHPPALGIPLRWMGHLRDEPALALLYSAADVAVVPSRQEAFGQSASEAHACGCPVVAFRSTGLTDVVAHQITGYLAEPFSSEDLTRGIEWVLADQERRASLGAEARNRALRLWSPEAVVPQYDDVYRRALEKSREGRAT